MSSPPGRFAPLHDRQLAELVSAHPLAWVVSPTGPYATPLPLRPILDAEGAIAAIHGHFARSNPQLEALRTEPRALLLFMGPHGYVSPSWMADRTQAPTWIYASLQILADIELQDTAAHADASLSDLVGAMEAERDRAWAADEMNARYVRLRRGVVPFLARPREVRAKIKAGQDERDDVLADVVTGLEAEGRADLGALVRTMNAARFHG
jgi:predicted FMN-binding regulatory protein PaiB